jgi:hypothetical protein
MEAKPDAKEKRLSYIDSLAQKLSLDAGEMEKYYESIRSFSSRLVKGSRNVSKPGRITLCNAKVGNRGHGSYHPG